MHSQREMPSQTLGIYGCVALVGGFVKKFAHMMHLIFRHLSTYYKYLYLNVNYTFTWSKEKTNIFLHWDCFYPNFALWRVFFIQFTVTIYAAISWQIGPLPGLLFTVIEHQWCTATNQENDQLQVTMPGFQMPVISRPQFPEYI